MMTDEERRIISDIKLRALTPTAEGRAYRRSLEQRGWYVLPPLDPGPQPSVEEIRELLPDDASEDDVAAYVEQWEKRRDAWEEHVRWALTVGLMKKPPKPKKRKAPKVLP